MGAFLHPGIRELVRESLGTHDAAKAELLRKRVEAESALHEHSAIALERLLWNGQEGVTRLDVTYLVGQIGEHALTAHSDYRCISMVITSKQSRRSSQPGFPREMPHRDRQRINVCIRAFAFAARDDFPFDGLLAD